MLERYADIGSIRLPAAEAAAEWQSLTAAFASGVWVDAEDVADLGATLLAARINATGILVCEIAKGLLAGLAPDSLKPAWRIVTFELDRLSRGIVHPSLYMAPVAAELAAGCRAPARPAGSFFLPIIPILPSAGGSERSLATFAEAIEAYRADYENALIRFARTSEPAALREMQTALIAIENRGPVAEYRIVMTLASAFISAVEDAAIPLDNDVRQLFSRIDAVLRAGARNVPVPDQCIASRLAHVLAQVSPTHKRSAHLQRRLGLKALFSTKMPAIAEFPPTDVFDTAFQALVDEFENFLADRSDGHSMIKAAERLRGICAINPDALRLAEALHGLLVDLAGKGAVRHPGLIDHLSQFMARLLDAVSSHDSLVLQKVAAEEVEAAARILQDGVRSIVVRDATSLSMVDFYREAAVDARVVFSLIEDAEDGSDAAVAEACAHLEMIEAALKICCQFEGAVTVERIRHKVADPALAKLYLPALDALVRYLDSIGVDADAAQGLLAEIRSQHLKARTKAADEDLPIDQEIFDIFFDEAREVIAAIRAAIGRGQKPLVDQDKAAEARRGFHSLKGSARMAGLTHLGEVMQTAENVFNTWLAHPVPYPVELSRFADRWAGYALSTCETIAQKGSSEVDEEAILDDADRLLGMAQQASATDAKRRQSAAPAKPRTGPSTVVPLPVVSAAPAVEAATPAPAIAAATPGAPASPTAPSAPASPSAATAPSAPTADESEFDPDLLALYFVESAEMLGKLREQAQVARHALPSFELIRAAHGLAGMSRTVGVPEIALVALPIEAWAARLSELRHRPLEKDIVAVLAAADEIERCIQAIRDGGRRAPDLSLVAGLVTDGGGVSGAEDLVAAREPGPAVQAPRQAAAAGLVAKPVSEAAEQIDPLVLSEFAEEATELLQALDAELASATPSMPQINRLLHTFKGGARLCGALRLGDLLHLLETQTTRSFRPDEAKQVLAEVAHGVDEVRMMFSVLLTPEAAEAASPSASDPAPAADGPAMPIVEDAAENVVFRVTSGQIVELTGQLDDMRVARDMLARQLSDAGEAAENIAHPARRIEELAGQIQIEAETNMDAGGKSLSEQFDALEFDRFTTLHELTRKLSEAVQDVLAFSESLSGSLARADRALIQNRSTAEGLALRLAGISRGPLDILESRLNAAVRSAAVTLGKDCVVELAPSKVRIERAVLDRIAPALDHLVRNSVAHGIESTVQRLAAGKPASGTITISARQRGEMAEILVADDGGGVNVEAVRRKIKERGLEKRYPDDQNQLEALFDSGFSTAETLTQVAGRGVGLDVVRDIVTHLGGRVRIENHPGDGVCFVLTVPVSASFVSGLMLTVGQGVYLLPGASVAGLVVLSGATVRHAFETGESVTVNGRPTQLAWLGSLVQAETRPLFQNHNKIVLVDGGRTGLFADEVQYMEALLSKPFPQAAAWGGAILGCAALYDGRTALILDPVRTLALRQDEAGGREQRDGEENRVPLVLVVDDSITVRKVTARVLQRHGFRVETAENGKVALEKLHDLAADLPAAILMDIEMPVMDGFEATRQIKSNPTTSGIRIIIISSRNVEKHIDHAKSLGADHFLGKPYKDETLIGLLREYATADLLPAA